MYSISCFKKVMITQHIQFCVLLNTCARHYFNNFMYNNTFKSHNIILHILLLPTFYKWEQWGTDWSSNLPKVFQESDGVRMQTPAVFWISMSEYEHFEWLCNIPLNDYPILIVQYLHCLKTLPNIWKCDQRVDFQENTKSKRLNIFI